MKKVFYLLPSTITKLSIQVNETDKKETANVVNISKSTTPSVSDPNQEKKPSNHWLLWTFDLAISELPNEIKTKIQDLCGDDYTIVWLIFTLTILFLLIKKNK
jgi:hypothetical protein